MASFSGRMRLLRDGSSAMIAVRSSSENRANPLEFTPGAPPRIIPGRSESGGELVQRWLPGAHVVKAFNSIGHVHMVKPQFPGGPPDMFICGNEVKAKARVTELLNTFGWPAIDIGGIESSRYLESLAVIWLLEYFKTGSGNHTFKLLRK